MELLSRVLTVLKTKAKSFGFDKLEMKSIATAIADNLQLGEDATEEEITTAIEDAVDKQIPMLKIVQSMSARLSKKVTTKTGDDDDDTDDDDENQKKSKKKSDEVPEYVKQLTDTINALSAKIDGINAEKLSDKRKSKLETLLKDTGTFGKSVLKTFSKMTFESDEDFDEYFEEVESDLKALNQERVDAGLEKMGVKVNPNDIKKKKQEEVATDEEIDDIAEQM